VEEKDLFIMTSPWALSISLMSSLPIRAYAGEGQFKGGAWRQSTSASLRGIATPAVIVRKRNATQTSQTNEKAAVPKGIDSKAIEEIPSRNIERATRSETDLPPKSKDELRNHHCYIKDERTNNGKSRSTSQIFPSQLKCSFTVLALGLGLVFRWSLCNCAVEAMRTEIPPVDVGRIGKTVYETAAGQRGED